MQCDLVWGYDGTRGAAVRDDVIIIVDTLSFSTAIVAGAESGAIIYPCPLKADIELILSG